MSRARGAGHREHEREVDRGEEDAVEVAGRQAQSYCDQAGPPAGGQACDRKERRERTATRSSAPCACRRIRSLPRSRRGAQGFLDLWEVSLMEGVLFIELCIRDRCKTSLTSACRAAARDCNCR